MSAPVLHDARAERAILAGCLLDASAVVDSVAEVLGPDDWYAPTHRLLWETVRRLHDGGAPIDVTTVRAELSRRGELARVGGDEGLLDLTTDVSVGAVVHAERYAEIVRERAQVRRLIAACREVQARGEGPIEDVREYLEQSEQVIFAATAEARQRGGLEPVAAAVRQAYERTEALSRGGGSEIPGLAVGLGAVDRMTTGMHPGELVVVAGRPGMGKSAYGVGAAAHVARAGVPVAVFSLEMTREQVVQRILAGEARVDSARLRTGRVRPEDWSALAGASEAVSRWSLLIDDQPGITIQAIRSRSRRAKAQHPTLGLIVVDYLQLVRAGVPTDTREREIAIVADGLKRLSKELSVPVMALAQLNREVERRQNKRPQLSDLRESGSVEQDADVVLLLYREDVYDREAPTAGEAEITVAKQRSGPTGVVRVAYVREQTRFADLGWDDGGVE